MRTSGWMQAVVAGLAAAVLAAGCGEERPKRDPLDVTGSWVLDREAFRATVKPNAGARKIDLDRLAERWGRMELVVSADGHWRFRGGFAYDGAESGTWRVVLDRMSMFGCSGRRRRTIRWPKCSSCR